MTKLTLAEAIIIRDEAKEDADYFFDAAYGLCLLHAVGSNGAYEAAWAAASSLSVTVAEDAYEAACELVEELEAEI